VLNSIRIHDLWQCLKSLLQMLKCLSKGRNGDFDVAKVMDLGPLCVRAA